MKSTYIKEWERATENLLAFSATVSYSTALADIFLAGTIAGILSVAISIIILIK
jgi:hypothetical protein